MILYVLLICCVFKQMTAYVMLIRDWSSDVFSSDLLTDTAPTFKPQKKTIHAHAPRPFGEISRLSASSAGKSPVARPHRHPGTDLALDRPARRSEEHTSELQSLMRISYAVFCLKKKTKHIMIAYAR